MGKGRPLDKTKKSSRPLLTVLVIVSVLLTVASVFARTQPIANFPSLVLAVGSPYTPLAALAGLLVAVACRRIVLTVLAAGVVGVSIAVQISWYYVGQPPIAEAYQNIRVLSSNLRYGQADPAFIVNLTKDDADVVTVSELTPEAIQRLKQSGIDAAFPYSHLIPAPGAGGAGVWSRYPLDILASTRDEEEGVSIPAARLLIPGLRFDPVLASVHVYSPVAGRSNTIDGWRSGMASAKTELDSFARIARGGAVIIGGDYNSTPDMRQFRDLLTNGYRDAVEQSGSGFAPTFPSNRKIPPLITIDHVLTRNAAAESVRTIAVPGSDHRALLATIRVPIDPTAS
ncbi:endonuclease [Mycolicibacterium rhodesiae]|uniref:Endonuclease n=1 Tax=Mycolicibacterium rhodesiae TaxID=36814 RepID=A0A1X0J263_MYCRH|nr:endonuclease [Mycolicibacterium rhodesiae]